jgi:putative endonuclease
MEERERMARYELAQQRGRVGERAAERFLCRKRGMRCLYRNWKSGKWEMDLVMMQKEVLVFVEVRTRQENALVPGYHTLTRAKRTALRQAGAAFLSQNKGKFPYFRLDVVEVNLCDDRISTIYHFENIPVFGKFQGY